MILINKNKQKSKSEPMNAELDKLYLFWKHNRKIIQTNKATDNTTIISRK
jgi:hypothetical protein